MNFEFLALECFSNQPKSKAELRTSSNPTLANSTRERGTLCLGVAHKEPKRERPGHPSDFPRWMKLFPFLFPIQECPVPPMFRVTATCDFQSKWNWSLPSKHPQEQTGEVALPLPDPSNALLCYPLRLTTDLTADLVRIRALLGGSLTCHGPAHNRRRA